jgi:uroporphyrinogen decarboxylase
MQTTPRNRWLALLDGKPADRIPTDYQATDEVTARLLRDLDCVDEEALYRRLHIDARRFVEPRWNRPEDCDPEADMWGIRYRRVDYGTGAYEEPVFHPLAGAESVEQVRAHRWPDPDEFDYGPVTEAVEADDGYRAIHAGHYEPFLLYGYLRGLERALEDLALRPPLADAILGRITDFYYEHHRRIFEAGRAAERGGRIDLTWVAEDLGTQTGPLMSLAMYRRFLLPGQIKMAELARSYGVHVMYHTDGAARTFLPDLIDRVGIEVLNPIQWRCPGMARERLVVDFGDRVIFHGSIDNQQTLAFGSVDDVADEVRQSVMIYAPARWICAPCHNIQPVTPTENILAMYQTIHELGRL